MWGEASHSLQKQYVASFEVQFKSNSNKKIFFWKVTDIRSKLFGQDHNFSLCLSEEMTYLEMNAEICSDKMIQLQYIWNLP